MEVTENEETGNFFCDFEDSRRYRAVFQIKKISSVILKILGDTGQFSKSRKFLRRF